MTGFTVRGYDQWFRVFVPGPDGSLERVQAPARAAASAYASVAVLGFWLPAARE